MADAYDSTKDAWGGGGSAATPGSPARRAIAVTPSDTKDVTNLAGDGAAVYAKSFLVGVGGNVAVVAAGDQSASGAGTAVTLTGLAAGQIVPLQVRRFMSTNTTATTLTAFYDR